MTDTSPFTSAVELYRSVGWGGTLPLPHRAKKPVPAGFTGYRGTMPTEAQVAAWRTEDSSGNIVANGVANCDITTATCSLLVSDSTHLIRPIGIVIAP